MKRVHFFAAMLIIVVLVSSCNTANKTEKSKNSHTEQAGNDTPNTKLETEQIMEAALEGKLSIVEDALNEGFDKNTTDTNKRTLLMLAAYNGHTEIVELLIAKGADINQRDTISRTALMFASTGPFVATVQALLQSGAQPNLIDNQENWTAAMMAAAEGQLEVLKVLVANGANLKMLDVDGESSLDFAKANGHTEVAKYIESQTK